MPKKIDHFQTATLVQLLTVAKEPITVREVCAKVGVPLNTVQGWLTSGRKRPDSAYGEFAAAWKQLRPRIESRPDADRLRALRDALDQLSDELEDDSDSG